MNLLIFVTVGLYFTKTCLSFEIRHKKAVANPLWNETVVDKLRNDLLTNYDRYAKPSRHLEVSNVSLGFGIYYLETDELNSTFSVSVELRLSWFDPKLIWNPDDYNGLRFLTMADHEIWQPDLYLLNSATSGGEAIARYGNALAVVNSNGLIIWLTPLRFTALCQFDLFYWPYDTQHCQLKFGSWSHSGRDLQLVLDQIHYEGMVHISQWNITNTAEMTLVKREISPDAFYQAVINLTLIRKSSAISSVVTTCIVVVTLLVLTQQFVVPKNESSLIVTCLVSTAICQCLLYFSTSVVAMGSNPPWTVTFFTTCLFLNAFTTLKLVLLRQKRSVPWIIKTHLYGKFSYVLWLNDFLPTFGEAHQDWELLTAAIDRICFLCYTFILLVLFLVYVV